MVAARRLEPTQVELLGARRCSRRALRRCGETRQSAAGSLRAGAEMCCPDRCRRSRAAHPERWDHVRRRVSERPGTSNDRATACCAEGARGWSALPSVRSTRESPGVCSDPGAEPHLAYTCSDREPLGTPVPAGVDGLLERGTLVGRAQPQPTPEDWATSRREMGHRPPTVPDCGAYRATSKTDPPTT